LNFELFSHKTYINIIFFTKYSNEYLDVVVKEYPFYFKSHGSSSFLSIILKYWKDSTTELNNKEIGLI